MRAAAFAPEVSRLLGVRVSRTVTLGWVLSSVVGSLAALLLVPTSLGLNPHATDSLFVLGFTVAVVGGLDSPVGALVGGVVVGVAMSLVTGYLGRRPGADRGPRPARAGAPAATRGPVRGRGGEARMSRRQRLPGQRPLARTLAARGRAGRLVALLGTFALDPFRNYQLALVAAYLCATAGLTVLVGATGQLSLGHAALMAVGGYGYALTSNALPFERRRALRASPCSPVRWRARSSACCSGSPPPACPGRTWPA